MSKNLWVVAVLALGLCACTGANNKSEAETSNDSIVESSAVDTLSIAEADSILADTIAPDSIVNTETSNQNIKDSKAMNTSALGTAKVKFNTTLGSFTVLLYDDTPKHRDNFLKLVRNHQYDSLLFHRVINQFMVQAGDPTSKNARPGQQLGSGDPGYTIEAEIVYPKHYHKRGSLAAARTGDEVNPERRSSGSQFYVVTGKKVEESQIKSLQQNALMQEFVKEHRAEITDLQRKRDQAGLQKLQDIFDAWAEKKIAKGETPITPQMIKDYTTIGGTPHLDGTYTVFGEVIEGMDTIEKIEKSRTGAADRPVEDIRILSTEIL